jgi:hypothetical protein
MYIPWSLDIKNQEVFYQENVNHADILWGMPVLDKNIPFSNLQQIHHYIKNKSTECFTVPYKEKKN